MPAAGLSWTRYGPALPAGLFGVSSSTTSGPLSIWAVRTTWPCWLIPMPYEPAPEARAGLIPVRVPSGVVMPVRAINESVPSAPTR